MTELPVYVLVADWPVWLCIAAAFGFAIVMAIHAIEIEARNQPPERDE